MNCHAADNFYCARTDLYIYVCGVNVQVCLLGFRADDILSCLIIIRHYD